MLFVSIKVYRKEIQQGETNNWSVAFGDSGQIWGHEESNYSRFESTITRNSKRAGGHKTGTQKNGSFYFILNLAIGLNLYINAIQEEERDQQREELSSLKENMKKMKNALHSKQLLFDTQKREMTSALDKLKIEEQSRKSLQKVNRPWQVKKQIFNCCQQCK